MHLIVDVLKNSVMVAGAVITMMLMIEYINVVSSGRWFGALSKNRFGQVLLGALLGMVPGCMGGFAAVSLYSHRLLGFGALIAMMIASSGDEAFVMLAMFPQKACVIFAAIFVLAIVVGLIVDAFAGKRGNDSRCSVEFAVHQQDVHHHEHDSHCNEHCPHRTIRNIADLQWRRIALLAGVALYIVALATGLLEHEHGGEDHTVHGASVMLDEYWINLLFSIVSLFALWAIATADGHFLREHLWDHVIKKHLLSIFLWTFSVLMVLELSMHYFDIASWTRDNVPFMILLAVLIGIIPESGPHLIFVSLFAAGAVPWSVMIASCISQDGHSSLPLLAETKRGFLRAKAINAIVAAAVGYILFFTGL